MIGFGMVFPLIPFYAQEFGATAWEVGLLFASFSIVQFFSSPILGRISDRFGRKPVLFWGMILGSASIFFTGIAGSLTQLFVARSLHGAVTAAVLPTARAYMADVTPPESRIAAMGKVGAAFALGFMIGPAFGSALVGWGGIHMPFFAASLIALFNALFLWLLLPESLAQKSEKLVIKEGIFNLFRIFSHLKSEPGILFGVLFVWSFGLSNNQVAFPLLVSSKFSLGADHIGYFFTAIALVSAVVQGGFLARIVKLLGEKPTLFAGMLLQGAGLFFIIFAPSVAILAVSFMVAGFGSALNRPTAEGIISRLAETGQGTTLGVANSFESLGRVFGPLLGGSLYGVNPAFPFIFSAALLWGLGVFSLRFLKVK